VASVDGATDGGGVDRTNNGFCLPATAARTTTATAVGHYCRSCRTVLSYPLRTVSPLPPRAPSTFFSLLLSVWRKHFLVGSVNKRSEHQDDWRLLLGWV
jgi:hypothetical protein